MPITTVNKVKTILIKLNKDTPDTIIPIYRSTVIVEGSELFPEHYITSFNTFIKNLKGYSRIESLPEIELPQFELEDTDTQRLYKTLDVEWKSPRKQIDFFISASEIGIDWYPIGSVSLLNPAGYPYRVYELLTIYTNDIALELGPNSAIGVRVKDVGFGKLVNDDVFNIYGSYVEEIFVKYEDRPININVSSLVDNNQNQSSSNLVNNSFLVGNTSLMGN